MDIKNTFLYFWCFISDKDDTKKWQERNNFNKIIFGLICLFFGIILLAIAYVIMSLFMILIALIGDYILNTDNCHFDDKYTILKIFMTCSAVGMVYTIMWFLYVMFTIILFIPVIPPVV